MIPPGHSPSHSLAQVSPESDSVRDPSGGAQDAEARTMEDPDNRWVVANLVRQWEQVAHQLRERGELPLDSLLTDILDRLAEEGELDALMVGSDDGFVVAHSSTDCRAEVLAAIGPLFEQTVLRAQRESIINAVEEMVLRGFDGEQVILRYFPGSLKRYFIVAYSKRPKSYRRVTTLALKMCGDLLARGMGIKSPFAARNSRSPNPEVPLSPAAQP